MSEYMDIEDVKATLQDERIQRGAIFSVLFVKRDGSDRLMSAKLAGTVSIGKTGRGMSYIPSERDLLLVVDMSLCSRLGGKFEGVKGAFRSIPLRRVKSISIKEKAQQ